jgi:hypothetical protein
MAASVTVGERDMVPGLVAAPGTGRPGGSRPGGADLYGRDPVTALRTVHSVTLVRRHASPLAAPVTLGD